jgi:hypothetical protein
MFIVGIKVLVLPVLDGLMLGTLFSLALFCGQQPVCIPVCGLHSPALRLLLLVMTNVIALVEVPDVYYSSVFPCHLSSILTKDSCLQLSKRAIAMPFM